MNKTFVELYKNREVEIDEIDDFIDKWHAGDGGSDSLHKYLGFTWRQYCQWVESNISLADILENKQQQEWFRSKKFIHNSVRNILNNELGVTREEVRQIIRERVDEELKQYRAETNLRKMMAEAIIHELRYKSPLQYRGWHTDQLYNEIKYMMKNALQSMLEERLNINVEIKDRPTND